MLLSKLHPRCDKCKEKDTCDEKRMVACGIMVKEYTPIAIYRGENCTIDTSLEKIKKSIEEDFYKNIRCEFNRTL
ncbi:hypothetical protein [Sporanaerobacter acetigenes]|uniref:Uncharacterized protein n=1 Tax=Sporanaerobacter acetigenes DSM 13106 TaxID=1123281 RepID=A0A1M5U0E5_9FIRM|nr:hypothetical protein [Sporanaerobacter acetigenes]SHH56346.1 hypothetical protein SAMN02745180_00484 [Sporanaerobacter acetigenes DSM 13106]